MHVILEYDSGNKKSVLKSHVPGHSLTVLAGEESFSAAWTMLSSALHIPSNRRERSWELRIEQCDCCTKKGDTYHSFRCTTLSVLKLLLNDYQRRRMPYGKQ